MTGIADKLSSKVVEAYDKLSIERSSIIHEQQVQINDLQARVDRMQVDCHARVVEAEGRAAASAAEAAASAADSASKQVGRPAPIGPRHSLSSIEQISTYSN